MPHGSFHDEITRFSLSSFFSPLSSLKLYFILGVGGGREMGKIGRDDVKDVKNK